MREQRKTRGGVGGPTGFQTLRRAGIRQGKDTPLSPAPQGKCARCPYSPGKGEACNFPVCPFSERGANKDRDLTNGGDSGKVGFPNFMRRHKRLSCLPRAGKSLAANTAGEASAAFGVRFPYIGRATTSRTREGWRLHEGRGELPPCLFLP